MQYLDFDYFSLRKFIFVVTLCFLAILTPKSKMAAGGHLENMSFSIILNQPTQDPMQYLDLGHPSLRKLIFVVTLWFLVILTPKSKMAAGGHLENMSFFIILN